MRILYLLSIWTHIIAAVTWIGGSIFLALVLVPVIRGPAYRGQALDLVRATGRRFSRVGWACLIVLVVTGVLNLLLRGIAPEHLASPDFWSSIYGRVLSCKITLVALILILSVVHDFFVGPQALHAWEVDPTSREARRLRSFASNLGRVNLVLGLIVVALAVMLVRGLPF